MHHHPIHAPHMAIDFYNQCDYLRRHLKTHSGSGERPFFHHYQGNIDFNTGCIVPLHFTASRTDPTGQYPLVLCCPRLLTSMLVASVSQVGLLLRRQHNFKVLEAVMNWLQYSSQRPFSTRFMLSSNHSLFFFLMLRVPLTRYCERFAFEQPI